MATPRKHWFRVADSIGDEDWDNDTLATLIRLQARLNTKWARNGLTGEEAGRITLTAGDAMAVTHRTSFARALQVLRRCTAAVSLVLHEQRASVKLEWPKWPEFQGLIARESPESRPLRKTPPQDARRKTQEERTEATPAPPAARASRPRKSPPARFPGSMTPGDFFDLACKHGVDVERLEAVAMGWATEKDRGYTADGWKQAIDRSLRDRWSWTQSLFAQPGQSPSGERESPAQAKVRRTKEAARRVLGRIGGDGSGEEFNLIPSEVQR